MRRSVGFVLLMALVAPLAACRDDTVRVSFRPEVGSTYRYEVEVRSTSETRLGTDPPEIRDESVRLVATHRVLSAGPSGARVRVVLREPGGDERIFVVVFDRAAQLEEVESIEGVPDEVLGSLGITEVFPAAAGAPPARPLEPGARWTIDDEIRLPGAARSTRLEGSGQLVELGVVAGEDVARLASSARLPLVSTVPTTGGLLRLDGVQVIDQQATHDLDDGAVRSSSARTDGRFDIALSPPSGEPGDPIEGTLRVQVESTTRRID